MVKALVADAAMGMVTVPVRAQAAVMVPNPLKERLQVLRIHKGSFRRRAELFEVLSVSIAAKGDVRVAALLSLVSARA